MKSSKEAASLANLVNGSAIELFDRDLESVIANIHDPNTDNKSVREIILTVKLKPTETQGIVKTDIVVKTKLSANKPLSTHLITGMQDGIYQARELYNQEPMFTEIQDKNGNVVRMEPAVKSKAKGKEQS